MAPDPYLLGTPGTKADVLASPETRTLLLVHLGTEDVRGAGAELSVFWLCRHHTRLP